jgi:hypothetical protein
MKRSLVSRIVLAATSIWVAAAAPPVVFAQTLDPIVYTMRVPAPETHYAEIEVRVPTGKRASIEMMMPVWSPGFYRIEDYAGRVDGVSARTPDGKPLQAEKIQKNRWQVQTGGQPTVVLSYRVFCNQRSVTTNYVGADVHDVARERSSSARGEDRAASSVDAHDDRAG